MITIMAWRNIWRNKARSLIIMLSIMLGLFAGLSVVALYKGMMRGKVRTVIDREVGHIQIHHKKFKEDYVAGFVLPANAGIETIREMPEVKVITQRTVTPGMLTTTTGSSGITVYGVVPEEEQLVSQLQSKIVEGAYFPDDMTNPILIGLKLAKKMKLKVKSKLVLTFTDSTNTMVSAAFRVAAIYQSENAPLDERTVYIKRASLGNLLAIGTSTHEMVILLHHDEDMEKVRLAIQQKVSSLQVETWEDLAPETELMVNTINEYSYIIMVIIMLALAFGIVNTMLMAILERTREVGMMVALGMNKVQLFFLILEETIFLTVAGCPFGLIGSWLGIGYFNRNGMDLSFFGEEMMSSFGFTNIIYPEFPYEHVVAILLIVVATSIISSLVPAVKALRLRPVEALRK